MELTVEKSKVMEFRKKGGRRKVTEFKWREEKIEEVREAMYLGYKLQSDNGDGKHIKHVTGKANAAVGKIWSLGERKFKEDWRKRIRIFDAMVKSVICYGAEIWGSKEWKEVEKIQDKYLKWVLEVERTTPGHILHEETKKSKIAMTTGNIAMKYEKKAGERHRRFDKKRILRDIKEKGKQVRSRRLEKKVLREERLVKDGSREKTRRGRGNMVGDDRKRRYRKTRKLSTDRRVKVCKQSKKIIIEEETPEYLGNNRKNKKGNWR